MDAPKHIYILHSTIMDAPKHVYILYRLLWTLLNMYNCIYTIQTIMDAPYISKSVTQNCNPGILLDKDNWDTHMA